MSFDWLNFVVLAEELRTLQCKGGVEARLRTSISRTYYGLFHQTRLQLQEQGLKFSDNIDAHQEVVQVLRTSGERERQQLGIELGRLRQYRNVADYDDAIANVAQMESLAAALGERVKKRLSTW